MVTVLYMSKKLLTDGFDHFVPMEICEAILDEYDEGEGIVENKSDFLFIYLFIFFLFWCSYIIVHLFPATQIHVDMTGQPCSLL